jgi:hypothetical protein
MLLSEVEAILTAVVKSLGDTSRNMYEVDNLYRLNRERIASVRAALADMSGAYVDELRVRCNEAEKQAEAKHSAGVASTTAADNAFSLDFQMEDGEEDNMAELEQAKTNTAGGNGGGHKRPSKKNNTKTKGTKGKNGSAKGAAGEEEMGEGVRGLKEGRTLPNSPQLAPSPQLLTNSKADKPTWTVLERKDDLASSELPPMLSTSGRGLCEPVINSPLALLFFTTDVDWDGTTCHCVVELYRCVVIALTYGEPQISWSECQKMVQAQLAAGVSTGKGTVSKGGPAVPAVEVQTVETESTVSGDDASDDDTGNKGDSADDLTLSEQLIAEYEQAQRAEAEHDQDSSALPRDVAEKLQQRLRTLTDEVWVVLLCHGGYFAGGVFVRGTCVIHKAFQRYVVRKKQGGKQSSNTKDVGSYNSVGSQIRAAQEVKWRVDVRDILLEWTPYIQAAAFILYAAPGPQNRAVLTDFSLLPAVAALGGGKGVSPIQLKDRRVSRVPITTHRPNFEEVQRIYNVCSRCSLLYVKEEAE